MHKRAPTDHPVHDLITERWSPRAFSDKPVAPDVLASVFEAARWAPSSSNEQPWAYIVATKEGSENFAKVVSVLVPANVTWAQHAPVLALAVAKLAFEKSGAPNRNAQYDVGAASAWLTAEATSRGLFVHQMAGFDPDKARQVFACDRHRLSGRFGFFATTFARPRSRSAHSQTRLHLCDVRKLGKKSSVPPLNLG
jgi:nitroreductase